MIDRRPCPCTIDGSRGVRHIYREVLFELVEGKAATPLFLALSSERNARARLQALVLSDPGVSVLFDYTGPPPAVARVRDVLLTGDQPFVLHNDILLDTEKHIRFVVTWRRPPADGRFGVSLEHILLDTVGAGGLLFGQVEGGVIAYKAASPGGRGLSEFLAAAQAAFGARFRVRPVRAGPFKPGWEIDDAPRRVDPDEEALLSAALAQGYYDEPKRCGVRELGDALGVSKSVVARRLRDLERRALERMVS
ncbi:MAG TPA: helix-turn-helix domain-containing protein [Candidatus Thermoplasmatota archaeon]|nr:helix-turn-helix domain-containing protein [Candidatus Thermoplasmatota archaeon]